MYVKPEFLIWQALWVLPFHWPGIYLELRDSQIPDSPSEILLKGITVKKTALKESFYSRDGDEKRKGGEKHLFSSFQLEASDPCAWISVRNKPDREELKRVEACMQSPCVWGICSRGSERN